MKNAHRAQPPGRPALDLIEQASQVLRQAPAPVLLAYYVGSVPAVLGLLFFITDMSGGAFARNHHLEAALVAALLYLWMKCWQAVFAAGLRNSLSLEPPVDWTAARIGRLIFIQATLQPTGLFARLIAAQIVLPYVWVYGFYQSVSVVGDGRTADVGEVFRRAAAQARLWPRQAHYTLLLLMVFALFVAINTGAAVFFAPGLLKTFFGIETVFSRSPTAFLNTTVFAAIAGLTYLAFDPLRKAVYVLRCFYGGALQSGDDLRMELKRLKSAKLIAVAALVLFLGGLPAAQANPPPGSPSSPSSPSSPPSVESARLDSSIEKVLQRREFAWRLPNQQTAQAQTSWLSSAVEDFTTSLGKMLKEAWRATWKFFKKFGKLFSRESSAREASSGGWALAGAARPLLYACTVLVALGVVLLIFRIRKTARPVVAAAAALTPTPDLSAENLLADQLPEDGWLRLARELMAAGELRLALRASYLAGLAHLGHRNLITIARHKSNRDYDRELGRRARNRESLLGAFAQNLDAFERAWYGLGEVTVETLGRFNHNLEKIRGC